VGSDDYHIYAFALNTSTTEPLHQYFNDTLSWTTVVFDTVAAAVAVVIGYEVVRFARSSWRRQRKPELTLKPGRSLAWFSMHKDALFILMILAFSTILFVNLGSGHLWVADEQTYSQWANHMVKSGDYLTPWADGFLSFYISKPPLTMWLMALSYQGFGVTNFASRFGSAVLGTLALVVVFYLGKKLFNSYVGFMSAIILGTFTTFYEFARHAMTDMPFLLFTVTSIYFLVLSEKTEKPTRYAVLSGVCLGLAFLTKQLIALLIPLIVIVYLVATNRSVMVLVSKRFTLFLAFGVLVFAPWLIYMGLRFGPDFFQVYFSYSDLSRIVSPLEGHAEGVFYYFTYLAQNENMLWVVLLPFAAGVSVVKAVFKQSNVDTLLIVWMAVVLLFFTVAQTRIYWYILPAFPAFAIVTANLLYQVGKKISGRYIKKALPKTDN
jgi:4-amino-4-deoxy-L-arabinose transferase-like glycosyltransferase